MARRAALFCGEASQAVLAARLRGIVGSCYPMPTRAQRGRSGVARQFAAMRGRIGNLYASPKVPHFYNRLCVDEIIRAADIDLAVKTMRDVMRNGKNSDRLNAARLLLDRALGPIQAVDIEDRLTELERLAAELQK